jgi:hypothetical protein
MARPRRWIQKAIKRPGALTALAKRTGGWKDGISKTWLRTKAKAGGRVGRQARLALTLRKLPKRGGRRTRR